MGRPGTNPLLLAAAIVLAMIGGAALFALVQRAAPGSLAGVDRLRVEHVVRDYVLTHPEIIPQAIDVLRDRDHAPIIAANRAAIIEPFGDAWIGNPQADVTLVEYFDYNCGFCRASLPTIAQLVSRDRNVRVVFREFPILSPESADAARLSLAAAEQGRFKTFHDALYAGGPVSAASMAAAGRIAGVDTRKAAAMAPRADAEIAANRQIAQLLGMTGTPSWVIGNHVVSATLSLDKLEEAVAAVRAAGTGTGGQ